MRQLLPFVSGALCAYLAGCAVVATPRDVPSTLVHGADSVEPISSEAVGHAISCLSDSSPMFWARYFNHSDIEERVTINPSAKPNRKSISFSTGELEQAVAHGLGLLPVFAQNTNHLDADAGRRHGTINASDLLYYLGSDRIVQHLKSQKMYFFLNQEPDDEVLTVEYYKGWVEGFAKRVQEVGGNSNNLEPGIYGRPQLQPALASTLKQIASTPNLPYSGLWLVSIDKEVLQPGHPAKTCGRLMNWNTALPQLPEIGPIVLRQYVLDARSRNGRSVDLNAVNPEFAGQFLDGLLLKPAKQLAGAP